jgi:GH24 family phage-related lysozyme (muramidase)
MAMTPQQWGAEVRRRIAINEGCSLTRYFDTVGVPTIAYGFNLESGDAATILAQCGVADPAAVIAGLAPITQAQADATFDLMLPGYVAAARGTLAPGIFDKLSDARRFVIVDLTYNMGTGPDGWGGFTHTQSLIDQAAVARDPMTKSRLFGQAADALAQSAWYTQVGNRAKRNVAMLRSSNWVDPNGNGSY